MKAVYVNGKKYDTMKAAAIAMGGTYASLNKAIDCGLPYKGCIVSYDPPNESDNPKRDHNGPLLRMPQVTP